VHFQRYVGDWLASVKLDEVVEMCDGIHDLRKPMVLVGS
jgi:hypothetical protein